MTALGNRNLNGVRAGELSRAQKYVHAKASETMGQVMRTDAIAQPAHSICHLAKVGPRAKRNMNPELAGFPNRRHCASGADDGLARRTQIHIRHRAGLHANP